MSDVVTAEEIEALMSTGLEASALQGIIDREEAWLADDPKVGIGQLVGERTQRIWVAFGDDDPLLLRRPTDEFGGGGSGGSLLVVDDGITLDDVVLTGPARIEKVGSTWNGPIVDVTYTPTDGPSVKRVVIGLVRIAITDSPYGQEATEGHSYSRPEETYRMAESLARSLNPHRGIGTLRLGSGATHRITRPT